MLNSPYIPCVSKHFLADHEWRDYSTGYTWSVFQAADTRRSESFQLVAILPGYQPNPDRGYAIVRHMATGRTFIEPLGQVFRLLDREGREGILVTWKDHIDKAIRRHNRHEAREARHMSQEQFQERLHRRFRDLDAVVSQVMAS